MKNLLKLRGYTIRINTNMKKRNYIVNKLFTL